MYSAMPAYVPAVVHHPDPYMLTPRESTSRAGWTSARPLTDIPEDVAGVEDYRPQTTFIATRDHKQQQLMTSARRPHTVNGPIAVERPWTNQSSRHSSTHSTSVFNSHVSVRNITVTINTTNTVTSQVCDVVDKRRRKTVLSVPSHGRSRRNLKADLLLAEMERRYRRRLPAGYSLKKRQEELPLKLQKHCVTLDGQRPANANEMLAR